MESKLLKMSPEEFGKRLSDLRRNRNVTQEDAAAQIGVSRPTYIAIEKGSRVPKSDEIIALAKIYGKSVHDLVNPDSVVANFSPQFRMSHADEIPSKSIEEAISIFRTLCEDYITLEKTIDAPMPKYQYPEVYEFTRLIESIGASAASEEIAIAERSRLNLGYGPINNISDILESDVGLRVFIFPLKEFKIAGMFGYTEAFGGCILINGSHPTTRQNWTLAHEYAHFLVDRYREEITVLIENMRKPKGEVFADAFASAFLMPAMGLRQRFNKVMQSRGDFRVADICLFADQYGVSVEAMTRRLETLQCIRGGAWERLSQNVKIAQVKDYLGISSAKGEGKRLPERFKKLAVQACEEGLISESKLMKYLRVERIEAREIMLALAKRHDIGDSGHPYSLNLDFSEIVTIDKSGRM